MGAGATRQYGKGTEGMGDLGTQDVGECYVGDVTWTSVGGVVITVTSGMRYEGSAHHRRRRGQDFLSSPSLPCGHQDLADGGYPEVADEEDHHPFP